VLEVFTALYAAAEQAEGATLDEEGTDRVTTEGVARILRGGNLAPALLRERDLLAVLTAEPQPVPPLAAAIYGDSPRAAERVRRALLQTPWVVYASQHGGSRGAMTWLDVPTVSPADDAPILAAIPPRPETVAVDDLAAELDLDAAALARHLCLSDRVVVSAQDDGLIVVGHVASEAEGEAA
jgi:hypothetical protein